MNPSSMVYCRKYEGGCKLKEVPKLLVSWKYPHSMTIMSVAIQCSISAISTTGEK